MGNLVINMWFSTIMCIHVFLVSSPKLPEAYILSLLVVSAHANSSGFNSPEIKPTSADIIKICTFYGIKH